MPNSESLNDMPLQRRDEMISQVWCFLIERGYTITAPAIPKRELCVCGHPKWAHADSRPTWCLVKGGCDCAEFEAANA